VGAKAMAWKDKSDKYGQNAMGKPKEPCHFWRIKAKLIKVTEWLIHTQNKEVDKGLFFHLLDLFIQLYLFKQLHFLSTVVAKYTSEYSEWFKICQWWAWGSLMCKMPEKEDQSHKPIEWPALTHNTLQAHTYVMYALLWRNKELRSSVLATQSQPVNKLTFPNAPYQ
jgi:hypothetical protein